MPFEKLFPDRRSPEIYRRPFGRAGHLGGIGRKILLVPVLLPQGVLLDRREALGRVYTGQAGPLCLQTALHHRKDHPGYRAGLRLPVSPVLCEGVPAGAGGLSRRVQGAGGPAGHHQRRRLDREIYQQAARRDFRGAQHHQARADHRRRDLRRRKQDRGGVERL